MASRAKAFERKKLTKVFQVPKKEWGYDSDGMHRLMVLVEPQRERESLILFLSFKFQRQVSDSLCLSFKSPPYITN